MFYHADYYRIILNAYDYECSQHHASFLMYVCGVGLVILPPPPASPHPPPDTHTRTKEPMKKTYESRDFLNKENGVKRV